MDNKINSIPLRYLVFFFAILFFVIYFICIIPNNVKGDNLSFNQIGYETTQYSEDGWEDINFTAPNDYSYGDLYLHLKNDKRDLGTLKIWFNGYYINEVYIGSDQEKTVRTRIAAVIINHGDVNHLRFNFHKDDIVIDDSYFEFLLKQPSPDGAITFRELNYPTIQYYNNNFGDINFTAPESYSYIKLNMHLRNGVNRLGSIQIWFNGFLYFDVYMGSDREESISCTISSTVINQGDINNLKFETDEYQIIFDDSYLEFLPTNPRREEVLTFEELGHPTIQYYEEGWQYINITAPPGYYYARLVLHHRNCDLYSTSIQVWVNDLFFFDFYIGTDNEETVYGTITASAINQGDINTLKFDTDEYQIIFDDSYLEFLPTNPQREEVLTFEELGHPTIQYYKEGWQYINITAPPGYYYARLVLHHRNCDLYSSSIQVWLNGYEVFDFYIGTDNEETVYGTIDASVINQGDINTLKFDTDEYQIIFDDSYIDFINVAPNCIIESPQSQQTFLHWEKFYLNGSASDFNLNSLNHSWYSNLDGLLGYSESIIVSTLSIGKHEIRYEVIDELGANSIRKIEIIILEDTDRDRIPNNEDEDDDNDLMPDKWEKKYGLNSSDSSDGDLDFDNDNFTNFIEYQTSTNPINPDSFPADMDNDFLPDEIDDDIDGDGMINTDDVFPLDRFEWQDTDGDGFGDNSDKFPSDINEWSDIDGDGYGDRRDEFPTDDNEWLDSDQDGYGNNIDIFPNDKMEWSDIDGDGYGDNSDEFPNDPNEWKDDDFPFKDGSGNNSDIIPAFNNHLIAVFIIVILIMGTVRYLAKKSLNVIALDKISNKRISTLINLNITLNAIEKARKINPQYNISKVKDEYNLRELRNIITFKGKIFSIEDYQLIDHYSQQYKLEAREYITNHINE